MVKVVRSAVVGLGSVNRRLLRILSDKRQRLLDDYNLAFEIICVSDSSGVAVLDSGYDGDDICRMKERGGHVRDLPSFQAGRCMVDVLENLDCDLVFEASPVNLETGQPGLGIARTALKRGTSVVLANKGPMVLAFDELHSLAAASSAGLGYSATVCGGLPVINMGRRDMVAADISMLMGVFNSTSNFILDQMADGQPYDRALAETQQRGIAEADPSLDVGGWDTANKLAIIANSMLRMKVSLEDIEVEGITGITAEMLKAEHARGNVIKLVALAKDGKLSVKPTILPENSFLGRCEGWEMGVEIHSDICGIMYHKLWEREPVPTAGSMMRDAVNIFERIT